MESFLKIITESLKKKLHEWPTKREAEEIIDPEGPSSNYGLTYEFEFLGLNFQKLFIHLVCSYNFKINLLRTALSNKVIHNCKHHYTNRKGLANL